MTKCPKCKKFVRKLRDHKKKCYGNNRNIKYPKIFKNYQETQR